MNIGYEATTQTLPGATSKRQLTILRNRSRHKTEHAQYPLPFDLPSLRPSIDVANIAYSLMNLNALLDNGSIAEYWTQGMELLLEQLSAKFISFSLLEPIPGTEKTRMFRGERISAVSDAILAWEHSIYLAWKSASSTQKFEVDEVPTIVGQYQIVHVNLVFDRIVRGSFSFAFEWPCWPSPAEHDAIANVVQSFFANGMRSAQLQSSRLRLEHSYTLFTGLHSLTSTLELRSVLEHAIELVTSALNAEAATIFQADLPNNRLVFRVTRGSVADELEERYIPANEGVVGWVFEQGARRVFNDMSKCEMFDSSFDKATGFHTRNILCVPLRVFGEKIGVLEVLNKKEANGFSEDDGRWLSVIADQVAVALKNAELYDRQRREQERLIKAQEDVRHQLARELHDNTAQMLNVIAMRTEYARALVEQGKQNKVAEELLGIEQIARQANREVRTLLYELRPIILESKGLIPALESYHRQLTATMACNVNLQTDLFKVDMNLQDASGVFSIIQEAVNNLRKYSQASNAWIRVRIEQDELIFEVEDDGVGFDVKQRLRNYDTSGSFGLLNMQERARILGGELHIQSPRVGHENGTLVQGIVSMASLKARLDNKPQFWLEATAQS